MQQVLAHYNHLLEVVPCIIRCASSLFKHVFDQCNISPLKHIRSRRCDYFQDFGRMGVDSFDALESPPTGNVDLAEVKKMLREILMGMFRSRAR